MPVEVLYLPGDEAAALADIDDYIVAIREGYRRYAAGGQTDPRTKLFHPDHGGLVLYYGAVFPGADRFGVHQYLGGFPDGGPWSLTFVADGASGRPLAVIDSAVVNPMKTGATGAVAVDTLANEDAAVVGVLGTGVQAKAQLLAVDRVRTVSEVRVYSPTATHREAFAVTLADRLDATVRAVGSAADAVQGAEIVITATSASAPVFDAASLDPGAHVTAMGQSHPEKRELDAETVARAVYVPDHRERAELASGELLGAIRDGTADADHVHAELGAVVAGTAPGRTRVEEVTVFDSGGTAIETLAAAAMLYERAREADRGIQIPMAAGTEATRWL